MAIRRHRLPRFWLVLTLGLVTAGVGGAYWWEQQLPNRLAQAAAQGRAFQHQGAGAVHLEFHQGAEIVVADAPAQ